MASKFIGRKVNVGLAKESVRGTAANPTYWLDLTDITVEDKVDTVIDENSVGVITDAKDALKVKTFAEGDLGGKVPDKSFGLVLLATMGTVGSVAKTAPNTAVYDHTFSMQEDCQHDSLTIEAKNPNEQLAFANVMLKDLEIKAELKKYVEFKAGFIGKAGAAAANTPTYTAENNFLAQHIVFKLATNVAGLTAAAAIPVKSFSIKIEKNVETDDVLGNIAPADFLNKQFAVTGQVELVYDATTYKTLFTGNTVKAMRIDMINTDITIGTSSNPELKIDLYKVKFIEWARTTGLNEVIKQTLKFKAFYSISDSKIMDIVLTNLATSY